MLEPMPRGRRIAYALGAAGWQISDRIVVAIGIYFYLPPSDTDLVPRLSDEIFLGVLTAYGLAGFSMAGFLALPNVIISQLIDLDEARTGANRSAMYFGAQGLLTKWVYGASAAILSLLFVKFGNSRAEPTGVLLVGPVAAAFCLVSALLYARYPERQVMSRPDAHVTC